MSRGRVLYHFRTQGTGAEGVHIAGVAGALEKLGFAVTFSSPTGIDPRAAAGENPFRAGPRRTLLGRLAAHAPQPIFELMEQAYNAVAFFRHRQLLRQGPWSFIYERHAFFLFATAWLAKRTGLPLVVEVNELPGDERVRAKPWLAGVGRWCDRTLFRQARLIVTVSPYLRRRLIALGVAEEKVLVLPNAVEAEALTRPAQPRKVRERHGFGSARAIGFVGWFVAWHRLDRLVAQFARLGLPDWILLLVGDGPLGSELRAQVRALGIEERVVFAGAVPHGEMGDYLAAMEIAVVPHGNAYRSPIKLFEAMAAGRAVLAPAVEPVEAVIRRGENGWLFNQEEEEDLGRQLRVLAGDENLRRRLGAQARRDVEEKYTWARNAEAVVARLGLAQPGG